MTAPAAARGESSTETWPEVQLYYHFNPRALLMLNSSPNRSLESGEKTNGEYGLYLNYKPTSRTAYRIGYMYLANEAPEPGGKEVVEHRIVLDYTYGWPIGRHGLLWDRTRIDLRDRDGDASQRLRNRLRYQQETNIDRLPVLAFVDAELYYDTRFDALSRYKFQIGANLSVARRVDLTPYVGWQIDEKPQSETTMGLGLVLGVHF
jgi:hypothetical protein